MKKRRLYLFVAFTLALSAIAEAQTNQPQEIVVQSWKKGSETVSDQTIRISLGAEQREYSTEIMGGSGKIYRLNILHNPLLSVKTEHWKIELREVLQTSEGKYLLGDDLLLAKRPGYGSHYFPREDMVGYLYPNGGQPVAWVGGNPFFEGYSFYQIKTARKIRIEQFYLNAKVNNYQFSSKDKSKLSWLDLSIEFQSADK
jgi:hypothetical protein